MKLKKILIFNLCLALFACDSETSENTITPPTPTGDLVLLKKTIGRDSEGEIYTTLYNYDGNKLTSVDYGDGDKNIFTYDDNDFLIKNESYNSNSFFGTIDLEYNIDGKLFKYTEQFESYTGVYLITYNDNNTFTVNYYVNAFDNGSRLWTFQNENLMEIYESYENENSINEDRDTYEYDNKNNAFKNIHAIDILNILSQRETGPLIFGNTRNQTLGEISTEVTYKIDGTTLTNTIKETYEYTYNADGYPINARGTYLSTRNGEVDSPIETGTIEYFYE